MQDLLAKMVLCAPTTWFQVVTGHPCISEQESYDMDGLCFLLACVEPYREHGLMSNVVVGWICLIRSFFNGGAASERVEVLFLFLLDRLVRCIFLDSNLLE